jgi:alpha-D-ribose 1-methylphosphonate 5-triphosphate diphosphatase PhnM
MATVSTAPAHAAGLIDRGQLAEGMRADAVRFRTVSGVPVLAWRLVGGPARRLRGRLRMGVFGER